MTQAYRRTSVATQKRKASNCRSDSSIDSAQNNSSIHKKKSKKGNKPKGLKVAKEDLRSIGSMVDRLDGR